MRAFRAPTVLVEIDSDVPMAAGLGSSAAASIAGLRIFERVTAPLPESTLLAVATSLEGHADNAAAALLGGMTSVVESPPSPEGFGRAGEPVRALRWEWPNDLRLIVATPFTGLATSKARAALSPTISRKDAVFNLQRVLSLVHALQNGEYDRLREALQDRWHQPARAALVPHLGAALAIDDPDVLGAFLSGAGPSVAVVARRDFARVERLLQATCEAAGSPVTVRTLGAHRESVRRGCCGIGDGEKRMKFVSGLTCHLCGATYPAQALWVCSECLGPLEVTYDYAAIRKVISRQAD